MAGGNQVAMPFAGIRCEIGEIDRIRFRRNRQYEVTILIVRIHTKPFITVNTTMRLATPSTMPNIDTMAITEVKRLRLRLKL